MRNDKHLEIVITMSRYTMMFSDVLGLSFIGEPCKKQRFVLYASLRIKIFVIFLRIKIFVIIRDIFVMTSQLTSAV